MRKTILLIALLACVYPMAFGQIGGESTYDFLNLTNSARMAALGGNQIAINDSADLNVSYNNPSMLKAGMKNMLALNYVSYFAGVNYGYAAYSFGTSLPGNFAVGMHYINYGNFIEALPNGEKTGATFNAAEYALNIIWSNEYKRLSYGINLKPILSSFENYQSIGIAVDLGVSLFSKNKLTVTSLVARNIGTQITTYYEGAEKESIPFDLQFGISQRLQHAPIRFAATMQHLQKWNLAQAEEDNTNGTTVYTEDGFAKKFMRHLVLGVELLPSPNFTVRAGYNYQRRQELRLDEKMSTVGFSWGFGFQISRFHINYGSARYHLAGSSNLISVALNLNEGFHKNSVND
ncbi:MAG TPA: type IX secretion system protein PorQ [Prolixibacteraceae bacterium]|nr:type IX secretion system protein PorQ [Prolixibacteraceae bacterium]